MVRRGRMLRQPIPETKIERRQRRYKRGFAEGTATPWTFAKPLKFDRRGLCHAGRLTIIYVGAAGEDLTAFFIFW